MSEQDLKLDDQGNINVDYYVRLAHKQRSEYLAQLSSSLKSRIKGFFRTEPAKLSASH